MKMLKVLLLSCLMLVMSWSTVAAQEEMTSPTAEVTVPVSAQNPEYSRGRVTKILEEQRIQNGDEVFYTQKLEVRQHGSGEVLTIQSGTQFAPLSPQQRLSRGTEVILAKQEIAPGEFGYVIANVYRLPPILWLLVGFFVLVALIARRQGVFSIVGMFISLGVLVGFIIPQILAGQSPILISIIGCTVVAIVTVYLSHGLNVESHMSLLAMFLSLVAVALLASLSVRLAHLTGLGSEEATFLQFGQTAKVNLQGLLLGGIMLGALGVLDDICIAQVSVIHQLKAAKPKISFRELYERGLAVGKDHVASLVNTLVLAYAGSSLPLFLLLMLNTTQPLWVTLNEEVIIEEVVRTLTGSIGLVLAVPLATLIASFWMQRTPPEAKSPTPVPKHLHAH